MVGPAAPQYSPMATIIPLGDASLLVRFGSTLSDAANRAAIALATLLEHAPIEGVLEIAPNLVSVLLRYDPLQTDPATLAGEVRLLMAGLADAGAMTPTSHVIPVQFGGAEGPDLAEVAALLGMTEAAFVTKHNRAPLRVLSTGFAPGFVYCGLHDGAMIVPRRTSVRPRVPAGSILFAAGQTAIAATDMPTGWHVIGRTAFANFDAHAEPPTILRAGDAVVFEAL